MYKFSQTSDDRLKTCDKRLQSIFYHAIKISKIDFGITEGYRSVERQKQLLAEGKTKVEFGKHNEVPSLAVDIVPKVNGKSDYSIPVLSYIAGLVDAIAYQMGYNIRWGGNWDSDGEMLTDQTFDDLPHFELID